MEILVKERRERTNVKRRNIYPVIGLAIIVLLSVLSFSSCGATSTVTVTSTTTTTTTETAPSGSPGGGAVINSDSIITGKIQAIRSEATGYPWEVDVLVETSENVGSLPNPTGDKIGQVITTKTDEDMSLFQVGQDISAKVKYVGDVPKPGISLYLYNITGK
jgi:hypothetical protein